MMKKAFRIFAAFTMLAVYLAMTVNVAFAALMCRCHHSAVHHAHCTHCADSGHAGCACPIDGFAFTDACNCNHDHSTSVDPYIQPRTSDDDDAARHTIQPMTAALLPSNIRIAPPMVSHRSYDEHGIPLIGDILAQGQSLRAPPAAI